MLENSKAHFVKTTAYFLHENMQVTSAKTSFAYSLVFYPHFLNNICAFILFIGFLIVRSNELHA